MSFIDNKNITSY